MGVALFGLLGKKFRWAKFRKGKENMRAKKIYTEEDLQNRLREEMDKFYIRQCEEDERQRLRRMIDRLEERVYQLEQLNGEIVVRRDCECRRPVNY